MVTAKRIDIEPVTRIEGHASIHLEVDRNGALRNSWVEMHSLRGFEHFVYGRAAEEIPRIVTRICGICPWMHHLAAVKAVEACFGITPPSAAQLLRELCLLLAHIPDKILHFFFLAAPDFLLAAHTPPSLRNIAGLMQQQPQLARRVASMRHLAQQMIAQVAGKDTHPVAAVPGGFSIPLRPEEHAGLIDKAQSLLDFALFTFEYAKKNAFSEFERQGFQPGDIESAFLGAVDGDGNLSLYQGQLRLMRQNGAWVDFPAAEYQTHLAEQIMPWSLAKMVYAHSFNEGFSLDAQAPRGIYRVNTLARINVCDQIATPRAQAELDEFRTRFGRPAQATMLFHWARLIELVYICERIVETLNNEDILNPRVQIAVEPKAGQGVGHVEAPRGSLIHDYSTDAHGCISRANLIVGTTHNNAAIHLSVAAAARRLFAQGNCEDETKLNRIEAVMRAYDP